MDDVEGMSGRVKRYGATRQRPDGWGTQLWLYVIFNNVLWITHRLGDLLYISRKINDSLAIPLYLDVLYTSEQWFLGQEDEEYVVTICNSMKSEV